MKVYKVVSRWNKETQTGKSAVITGGFYNTTYTLTVTELTPLEVYRKYE